jgi:hypothetical protein
LHRPSAFRWKIGVRYLHGKLLIYRNFVPSPNPGEVTPSWAVDIREIIAMFFTGVGAIALLCLNKTDDAMKLLIGLMMYATGRTVPGGKQVIYKEKEKKQS